MSIPIVNLRREIVAWTDVAPVIVRNRLRHRKAERLLGGPIFCVEIMLTNRRHLAQAGAPPGWRSSWRCLALCSDERIGSVEQIGRFLSEPASAPTQSAAGPRLGGARPSPGLRAGED
jgi:hypothetical protein